MKFIFLLIFITTARSKSIENAIPSGEVETTIDDVTTTPSYSTERYSTDSADENEFEQNKEDDMKVRNWDCTQNEESIRSHLMQTSEMLEKGKDIINQQDVFAEDTILVLGRAGCGKTSFVQFLAGDNTKLVSKEIGNNTGEFLIEDGLKISSDVIDSFTLYPDPVPFNSSVTFCDTPGFRDTRSPNHEVVATNVMKKVVEKFQNIRIVLLASYNTLQSGVDKNSFTELLRHVHNFISDLKKYNNHVVLIATKVPEMYIVKNGVPTKVPDINFINSIEDYVSHVKSSFMDKLKDTIDLNEKSFYKDSIELLESIAEKDSNGKPTKINIFRRPNEPGPLANISVLQENKASLLSTIFNNIESVESDPNDFDYTLSDRAKIYLACLLRYANDYVIRKSNRIYQALKNNYNQIIDNYKSLHGLVLNLTVIEQDLDKLQKDLKDTSEHQSYLRKVESFAKERDVSIENYDNDKIVDLNVYINTMNKFFDTTWIFSPSSWSEPVTHVLHYIKDNLHWYRFLNDIYDALSSYKIQREKDMIMKQSGENVYRNVTSFMRYSHFFMDQIDIKTFNGFTLNDNRIYELDDMINATVLARTNITCNGEGTLLVKGYFVRVNEIHSKDKIRKYCGDIILKEVVILSASTVFIDANMDDEMFRGVDVLMVAPTWEVVGRREIILDGVEGKALVADLYVGEDKRDGRPGLPGGNGGNFFGVGLNFVNGAGLVIKSNGGRGGPGIDGKKGRTGENGKDGYEKFYDESPSNFNKNYSLTSGTTYFPYSNMGLFMNIQGEDENEDEASESPFYCYRNYISVDIDVYERNGECGGNGGIGGNGGVGGIGGHPGKQHVIELKDSSNIILAKSPGLSGNPGFGGIGGQRGASGQTARCYKVNKMEESRVRNEYWSCVNATTTMCKSEPEESTGHSNYTSIGIEKPKGKQPFEFSYQLLDYALLLENESNNKFYITKINNFKNALNQKFSYNMENWWKLIFKQFSTL